MSIEPAGSPRPASFSLARTGVILGTMTLLAAGAMGTRSLLLACRTPAPVPADKPETLPKEYAEFVGKFLPTWPTDRKPEVVLFFSGEQHNYEGPCGCSEPQYGGLERRYNFISQLKGFDLKVVPMDLGDIYHAGRYIEQSKLKYQFIMKALHLMDYEAVAVGQEEFRIPLIDALANTVLQNNYRYGVLGANILDKDSYPGANGSMIENLRIVEPKDCKIKVGITATLGRSVVDQVAKIERIDEKDLAKRFGDNGKVLTQTLKAMAEKKADVRVLLYQGTAKEAEKLAGVIKDFDVILCRAEDPEPPGRPDVVGKTHIIQVGHKGKYVVVAGVFRNDQQGLEYRFDLVKLSPELRTPADLAKSNKMIQLLEDYTKEVRDKNLIARVPQVLHPLQAQFNNPNKFPSFVGSEKCKDCHKAEWTVWDQSKHVKAHDTLVTDVRAKRPGNREFDAECIVCHTVGFGYKTGYTDVKNTPHLAEVGCENCHGPASLHVADPKNKQLALALSPWKDKPNDQIAGNKPVENKVYAMCFKCHDSDNDVHWDFDKRWKAIQHGPGAKKKKN